MRRFLVLDEAPKMNEILANFLLSKEDWAGRGKI